MAAMPGPPQAAPAPPPHAAPPPAAAAPPIHQATGPAAQKLYNLAHDAGAKLEQLATGLAQAHADPAAVTAVSKMADVTRKIQKAMVGAAQAEQPKPHTMSSATDAMHADLQAARANGAQPQ